MAERDAFVKLKHCTRSRCFTIRISIARGSRNLCESSSEVKSVKSVGCRAKASLPLTAMTAEVRLKIRSQKNSNDYVEPVTNCIVVPGSVLCVTRRCNTLIQIVSYSNIPSRGSIRIIPKVSIRDRSSKIVSGETGFPQYLFSQHDCVQ